MQILQQLKQQVESEESPFRAQLMREDIRRLETLVELAAQHADIEKFLKAGAMIGWTQGDLLTHQIKEPLDGFLRVLHGSERNGRPEGMECDVTAAWHAFSAARMERLVRCL